MKKKLCAIIATLGNLFFTSNCMLLLLKMYCIHCWSGLSLDLLSLEDLAFRFKVSVSSVSGIISTWVPFLGRELASLIYWPRKDELQLFYPEAFKQFPHVSSIIDCPEIFLERPSMADTQALTYSTYKSHNTAKYLVRLGTYWLYNEHKHNLKQKSFILLLQHNHS